MDYALQLQKFTIEGLSVSIFVPVEQEVRKLYKEGKIPFPYWSQVWPSAIALSQFLIKHKHLLYDKKIIELAGGLGLPSMFASMFARKVICSDSDKDSVAIIEKTIIHLGLKNCTSCVLDWNNLPDNLEADVLLLSDINYNPDAFPALKGLIYHFLQSGSTIFLATPQRLMAKDFIEAILPFTITSEELMVDSNFISVFLIKVSGQNLKDLGFLT